MPREILRFTAFRTLKTRMHRKTKSTFDINAARAIRLQELQLTESEKPQSRSGEALQSKSLSHRKKWREPRRPTLMTTLKELARWLALADARAVRTFADLGEIRLHRVSSHRFYGCMMDVARLNPRCLEEATPL